MVGRPARATRAIAALIVFDLAIAGSFAIVGAPVASARLHPESETGMAMNPDSGFAHARNWGPAIQAYQRSDERSELSAAMRSMEQRAGFSTRPEVRRRGDANAEGFSHRLSFGGTRQMLLSGPEAGLRLAGRLGIDWVSTTTLAQGVDYLRADSPGEDPHYFLHVPDEYRWPFVSVWTRWDELASNSRADEIVAHLDADSSQNRPVVLVSQPEPTSRQECFDTAKLSARRPSDISIHANVRTSCMSLVRIEQVRMPGWVVEIDGRPAQLQTVDFGFMGVFVPPGEHGVVFRYDSVARRWFWVWVLSCLAASSLSLFGFLPRRGATEVLPKAI